MVARIHCSGMVETSRIKSADPKPDTTTTNGCVYSLLWVGVDD